MPYAGLNGIQAALAVMERGLRPDIPAHTPADLAALIRDCWQPIPGQRPGFDTIAATSAGHATGLSRCRLSLRYIYGSRSVIIW